MATVLSVLWSVVVAAFELAVALWIAACVVTGLLWWFGIVDVKWRGPKHLRFGRL